MIETGSEGRQKFLHFLKHQNSVSKMILFSLNLNMQYKSCLGWSISLRQISGIEYEVTMEKLVITNHCINLRLAVPMSMSQGIYKTASSLEWRLYLKAVWNSSALYSNKSVYLGKRHDFLTDLSKVLNGPTHQVINFRNPTTFCSKVKEHFF